MSGHISKESWSRCEQPSMLYDSVRNPSAPHVPPKASTLLSSSKDTIETVQQRLNREMLEKLHSRGNHLPHDSFVAVVQIGKYLFLAVMLPPYLCFYGVPKWILLQLLPQLTEIVKQVTFKYGQFFLELSKQMIDLMKGMIDQTIGYSLRTTKDRFRSVWERIGSLIKSASDTVVDGFKKINQKVANLKHKLKEYFDEVADYFSSIAKSASEKFKSASSTVFEPVSTFAAKIAKNAKQTIVAGADKVFNPMGEAYAQATQQVEALKQHIIGAVKKMTDPLTAKISGIGHDLKESVKILLEPILNTVIETYEKATGSIKRGRKIVEDQVKAVAEAAQTHAAAFLATAADQVRYAWQMIPMTFNKAGKQVSRLLPKKVKDRFAGKKQAFQKWKGYTGRIAAGAGNGIKEVTAFTGKGIAFSFDGLIQLFKLLYKCIKWAFVQTLALPKRLLKVSGKVLKASGYVLSRLGFTLQILIALIWALCLYGAYLVSSTGNRVIKTS